MQSIKRQKPKRPKIIKEKLEKELARYSSRIQKLASKAYQIRTMLEDIALMEQSLTPAGQAEIVKDFTPEATDAIHSERPEGTTSSGSANSDSGQSNILDAAVNPAVLAEQPAELRHDSADIGLVEGSGV